MGEGAAPCGGGPREDCMVEEFKGTLEGTIVRRIPGEKGGPCACSYIGSGGKTRRHGERAGRREGAKRDDEVTVPVWFLTGREGIRSENRGYVSQVIGDLARDKHAVRLSVTRLCSR